MLRPGQFFWNESQRINLNRRGTFIEIIEHK